MKRALADGVREGRSSRTIGGIMHCASQSGRKAKPASGTRGKFGSTAAACDGHERQGPEITGRRNTEQLVQQRQTMIWNKMVR